MLVASSRVSISRRLKDLRDISRFLMFGADRSELTQGTTFGDKGDQFFRSTVASANSYLEFGSGASTYVAARLGVSVVTVDSDRKFLEHVEIACRFLPAPRVPRRYIHADIGLVGPWGQPLLKSPSRRRELAWMAYPTAPWRVLGRDFHADVVLVDGRFRVACALATAILQAGQDWTLLFDDYLERPAYWKFEAFGQLVALHGRMAEFRPKSSFDLWAASVEFGRALRDFS